jgi:hypothetical protein
MEDCIPGYGNMNKKGDCSGGSRGMEDLGLCIQRYRNLKMGDYIPE